MEKTRKTLTLEEFKTEVEAREMQFSEEQQRRKIESDSRLRFVKEIEHAPSRPNFRTIQSLNIPKYKTDKYAAEVAQIRELYKRWQWKDYAWYISPPLIGFAGGSLVNWATGITCGVIATAMCAMQAVGSLPVYEQVLYDNLKEPQFRRSLENHYSELKTQGLDILGLIDAKKQAVRGTWAEIRRLNESIDSIEISLSSNNHHADNFFWAYKNYNGGKE